MTMTLTRVACITVMLLGCSKMRDDSMQQTSPQLPVEIKLNPPLQDSKSSQAELARTVRSLQRHLQEDTKNESLTDEQSVHTHQIAVEELVRFAETSPGTTAALTAKLLCAKLLPYSVQGVNKNAELRRTAIRLLDEICREHAGTWQAAVCPLTIANMELEDQIQSVPPEQRQERERIARPAHIRSIEKALVDLPAKLAVEDRSVAELLNLDFTASDPIRAQLLMALATSQYNFATLDNQPSAIRQTALKQVRERFQTLATEFPQSKYAAHCRHMVGVMIDPQLEQLPRH